MNDMSEQTPQNRRIEELRGEADAQEHYAIAHNEALNQIAQLTKECYELKECESLNYVQLETIRKERDKLKAKYSEAFNRNIEVTRMLSESSVRVKRLEEALKEVLRTPRNPDRWLQFAEQALAGGAE